MMRIPSFKHLGTLLFASLSLVVVTAEPGIIPSGPFKPIVLRVVEESTGLQALFQFTPIDPAVKSFVIYDNKDNKFQMSPEGWLFLNDSLDREQRAFFVLPVEGLNVNGEKVMGPITITIRVIDINDQRPQFGEQMQGIVRQHSKPGKPFMWVNATDLDDSTTLNAKLQYTIYKQVPFHGDWLFQIDNATGAISTTSKGTESLDPNDPEYELIIKVQDSAEPFLDSTAVATITVKENLWQAPEPINIIENSPEPHPRTIVQVQWNGPGAIFELRLKERMKYKRFPFAVDKYGNISVTEPLDREEEDQYTFLVYALDNHRIPLEEPLNIHITVKDINDNVPVCEPAGFEVQENEDIGFIGDLIATDLDEPDTINSLLNYQLVKQMPEQPQDQLFSIDPFTGKISRNTGHLMKHIASHYNLTILVSDRGDIPGVLSTECIVQITVIDINDQIPVFVRTVYPTINLKEDYPLKIEFGRILATDKDDPSTGSSEILYRIIKGDDKGTFHIVTNERTNEGLLTLAQPLDFETQSYYSLTIRAENPEPLVNTMIYNSTATLNITVENVSEPPYFLNSSYRIMIHENLRIGTALLQVKAVDPEGKSVSYSITSDPLNWVNINPQSGEISIKNNMDREVKSKYDIKVTATERGFSSMSSTVDVAIILLDVNDNTPEVSSGSSKLFTCFPVSNEQKMIFKATDRDTQYGFPYTFSMENNRDWKLEAINGSYAYIVTKHRNYEKKVYEVSVKITDNGHLTGDDVISIDVCSCTESKFCKIPVGDIEHASLGLALGILLGVLVLIGAILAVVFYRLNRKKKGKLSENKTTKEETVPMNKCV